MFGWHGRLERKLRKQGKAAWATVLSAQVAVPALYINTRAQLGALQQQRASNPRWKMMVRVEPGGEPPFDAELSGWLKERPRVVPVLYDPSDHRKVLLDKPAYEARKAAVRRGTPAYLLASGQRVRGVLKSFVDTGTTARSLGITPTKPELFDAPRYMLEVELHIPNLAPITSRVTQPVPQDRVPNLALGLPLTCAVDYADPQQLCVVDWDAITG